MKTVFGLFSDYTQAQAAIDLLQAEGFNQDEMNVIVQTEIARDSMDVDLERAKVQVTSKVGQKTIHGLDAMLAGEQSVTVPDVGEVFAAGELATLLVRTAAAPGEADHGLKRTLIDFNIPPDVAREYRVRVEGGGVLFFIRTRDERASQAVALLKENHGMMVSGYAGE
jgi:hypothetical protein